MKKLSSLILVGVALTLTACVPGDESTKAPLKFKSNPIAGAGVVGGSVASGNDKEISIAAYKSTLLPLLRTMSCVNCHGDSKLYQPYYAISDGAAAWQIILNDAKKVNLDTPEASRIYLRLKNDKHNCLSGATDTDCNTEAEEVLAAIKKWKDLVMVSASATTAVKTDSLFYKNTSLALPSIEYGTILFEGEQDSFPEAMIGRFVSDLDGKASGFKYALTPAPIVNPTTQTTRKAEFQKGNACEVTTSTMLTDSSNGPYKISENGTHINSDQRASNGLIIKDGYIPFSIGIRGLIVRPDKRINYAKMLTGWSAGVASGIRDYGPTSLLKMTNETFDVTLLDVNSRTRVTGPIDISDQVLVGAPLNEVSLKVLPYFTTRDLVFQVGSTSFINEPSNRINNITGGTLELKNLFKLPMDEFTSKNVHDFMEVNDSNPANSNKFRKDIMYKFIKEKLDAVVASGSRYSTINGMDSNHIFSLYGKMKLNIMACPNVTCSASTQDVEVTSGTDSDGVALTYENALDILKVNSTGDGFVTGSIADLAAGKAFRRMDAYVVYNITPDSRTLEDSFDHTFYNYANGTFSEKSKISFPIKKPVANLDLKAFYSSGANALSKTDSLANFQSTLYPVIQKSNCIACHDGGMNNRVLHSSPNAVIAFNEIERTKLVNFSTPMNSFRKVFYPGDAKIAHNCGTADADCSKTQTEFLAAINSWNAANEISMKNNSSLTYQILSEKERSPGMLEYKFTAKKSGYYNIWTKVKSVANQSINLRVLDGTTPLNAYSTITNPMNTQKNCIEYKFLENTLWTWFTPGRADDLAKLDALGNLKKDGNNIPLVLNDNRTYWRFESGKTYTLQIFESQIQTKIDLIGIDYVSSKDNLLDFQPDLLARDENNIYDYKKRILNYDISKNVGLATGSAFLKVEVKTALDGQSYIFRNPRIQSSTNLSIKKITLFINGKTSFNDATWNNINVTAGDDQILTFAPLVALYANNITTDYFQFAFETIEKTTKTISELDPRGTAPSLVEGRKCRELDLFLNTVKPILRNARLMGKTGDGSIGEYLKDYPGGQRRGVNTPGQYQCMTCHNDNHPYFKMTTFDYPEILCAQALSRVDFANYRESLLVRGIDGSGVHPKIHFIEELQYASDTKSIVAYDETNGARVIDGQIKNQVANGPAFFTKLVSDYYFNTYSVADLGLNSVWNNNSAEKKALAVKYLGQFRRINYVTIPDLTKKTYYEPFIHDPLKGMQQTEFDNIINGVFNENSKNIYNTHYPISAAENSGGPVEIKVVKDANNRVSKSALDYSTPEIMNNKLEDLKDKYRNVILNWIEKEHVHILNGTKDLESVAPVTILPAGGNIVVSQLITMTSNTVGAQIRYTLDGSIPTGTSTLYTVPFVLPKSAIVTARGFKTGMDGSIGSSKETYTFKISNASWKVLSVDSEDTNGYRASYAFDNDISTIWHTEWRTQQPPPPHTIVIDLGKSEIVGGFKYIPRQDYPGSIIQRYEFYVSTDGINWGTAASIGTMLNDKATKDIFFTAKTGRYIKLVALGSAAEDNICSSIAELQIVSK